MNEYSFIHSLVVSSIVQIKDKAKYRAILNAAIQVMAVHGFYHAQISKIAKCAGVADGTVYLYFKNKEDILISILRETIQDIRGRVDEELKQAHSSVEGLQRLIATHLQVLGENPDLAMVTQVHLRNSNLDVRQKIAEIMHPYQALIHELIEKGVQSGQFRHDLDVRVARRMIFGTLDETVTAWILTGAKYELTSLVQPVLDVLLRGCQTNTK